jgi:hypothetical protein
MTGVARPVASDNLDELDRPPEGPTSRSEKPAKSKCNCRQPAEGASSVQTLRGQSQPSHQSRYVFQFSVLNKIEALELGHGSREKESVGATRELTSLRDWNLSNANEMPNQHFAFRAPGIPHQLRAPLWVVGRVRAGSETGLLGRVR